MVQSLHKNCYPNFGFKTNMFNAVRLLRTTDRLRFIKRNFKRNSTNVFLNAIFIGSNC